MLSAEQFKAIVSGDRRGIVAGLCRTIFQLAEWPYTWAVNYRNRAYDNGRSETHRVAAPVICVGNLTLGGTGKTPMVHYIARWLRDQGIRVAIVSRGYGAENERQNDEARELYAKLPDVPHIQNADRVAACRLAIDELEMQVIVLDDGFQHRRLERDLDIVLLDALEPYGFDHVFPRGTLREPLVGLARADVVVLSRADLVDEPRRTEIRDRLQPLAPRAFWIEVSHQPTKLIRDVADATSVEVGTTQESSFDRLQQQLREKNVAAFCGIGNPSGFQRTLEQCGAKIVAFRAFADHHAYSRDDIESIKNWIADHQPDLVICTHKDLVKIEIDELAGVPLRALAVEMKIEAGEQQLHQALKHAIESVDASGGSEFTPEDGVRD